MDRRIVIVTGSMSRGGAEGVIASISNELAKRGWDIYIISILSSKCEYDMFSTIKYIDISKKRNQILDIPRIVLTLRRKIKEINPSIVLSFMIAVNTVSWIATRGLKVCFVPSERNDPRIRNLFLKIFQRFVYVGSNHIIFQTLRAQSYFSNKTQRKSFIIPNPVKKISNERIISKTIVNIGRLSKQKNQKLLIDAFGEIVKEYPDYKLEIYGEGELKNELDDKIRIMGLSDRVSLCGKTGRIDRVLEKAYLFVLSSDFEGLSNALLEAMSFGIPCITTNCAGSEDVILDKFNGIIVPVNNKYALINAMKQVLNDDSFAAELGKRAKESMSRLDTQNIVDKWEDVLNRCIQETKTDY